MIDQNLVEPGIWRVVYSGLISKEEAHKKPLEFIELLKQAGTSRQYVLFEENMTAGSGNTMELKPLLEIWRRMNGGTFIFLKPLSPGHRTMVEVLKRVYRIKTDFKVIPNYGEALAYARALRDGKVV